MKQGVSGIYFLVERVPIIFVILNIEILPFNFSIREPFYYLMRVDFVFGQQWPAFLDVVVNMR